jgi:preprotein translocase subunit SecE
MCVFAPRAFFLRKIISIKNMSIKTFIEGTKNELHHVNWPGRKQVVASTIAVILIAVLVGYFLGVFDFAFSRLLEFFIIG